MDLAITEEKELTESGSRSDHLEDGYYLLASEDYLLELQLEQESWKH